VSDEDDRSSFGKGSNSPSNTAASVGQDVYDTRDRSVESTPDLSEYEGTEEETGEGYSEWEEFEHGDEKFIEPGDRVRFEKDGEEGSGEIARLGDDDLLGVETEGGDDVTITSFDITEFQTQKDDLDDIRQELREHFENAGVSTHSSGLQAWTNDSKYRDFQDHLRSAEDVAKESPMYEHDPKMETSSAILATTDADTATQIQDIQGYAKNDLPSEMTVYRGINVDADSFLDRAEESMESGEPLADSGFQSTSINEDVSDSFGNITLEIETDHGVYVRAASEHAGEDEILLPAGTEYSVSSVDRENNRVEVVANGGYDFGIDVDFIREEMEERDLDYHEAVEEVI